MGIPGFSRLFITLQSGSFTVKQGDQVNGDLNVNKFSGYFQDNILFGDSSNSFTLQAGVRFNYNSLNNEFFISPRLGASWKPNGEGYYFRAAAGIYDQPPFYRELRRYDGTVNTDLKAQRSFQGVAALIIISKDLAATNAVDNGSIL